LIGRERVRRLAATSPTYLDALSRGSSLQGESRGHTTAIYLLDLKTQRVSKLRGSEELAGSRVSHDGRYLPAGPLDEKRRCSLGPVRLGYCPTILRCSGSTGVHKKSTGSIFSIVYL